MPRGIMVIEKSTEQELQDRLNKVEWEVDAIKQSQLLDIKTSLVEIREEMKEDKKGLVSKTEFAPVKIIVYGLVGTILTSVLGALLALIITKL